MKIDRIHNHVLHCAIALLSFIGIVVVVQRTILVVSVLINRYHPPAMTTTFSKIDGIFATHPALTLIHIIPGLIFVICGPFQFIQKIRTCYPGWHRRSGRIFLVNGIIIGITGFVMSFAMPAIGGPNQAAATVMFSLILLYSLFKAAQQILQGNILLHREWAIRAYSTGLAVATIRIINGIFFATSPITHLKPQEFFGIGFWIGFVLHLILAEVWISKTRLAKTKVLISDLSNDSFAGFKGFNN